MKKPIIAVDCDDVLVSTADQLLDYYYRAHGIHLSSYNELWQKLSSEATRTARDTYLDSEEFLQSPAIANAVEVLRKLNSKYELHIVTGRPSFMQDVTLSWLQKHLPDIFESVIFTNSFVDKTNPAYQTKADVCQQIGAHFLIDDHMQHCEVVSRVGIQAVLFGQYPWNQVDRLPNGIVRCKDWQAVADYLGV